MAEGTNIELVELYREHRDQLLRVLNRKLRNMDDAEEVLQETFIQYQKAARSTDIDNPKAFLFRISSNLAVDLIRHRSSQRAREEKWTKTYVDETDMDREGEPGQSAQDRQLAAKGDVERVISLLDGLSPKVRRVFVMHKFQEMSHAEVAQTLGIAKSTVEKHMIKALRHLTDNWSV
jgi:RNA polymerase sigma-70 factor (ECF subfamily)